MSKPAIRLAELDEVRITLAMDNSFDMLLQSDDIARRFPNSPEWLPRFSANPDLALPIAEHGFSALISARQGDRQETLLFDTGVSRTGLLHNLDALEIRAAELRAIVLSHGHFDHAMGLTGLVERLGNRRLPLVLHPEAYLERKLVVPSGFELKLPPPKIADLRSESVEVIEEVGPSMMVDGMLLVSGEIARRTDFEKGFPIHFAKRNAHWEPDPLIMDDQCTIANVKDKGLVIVTGCGHAGIINIVRNAQRLTGIEKVHAVVGGFHLSGGLFESIIPRTVSELKKIQPRYVMPGHCTGWVATHAIARAMPRAFIPNSVGTTLIL